MQASNWGEPMDVNDIIHLNKGSVLSGGLIQGSSQMYILPGDMPIDRENVSLNGSDTHRYYGTIDEYNNGSQNFIQYTK